MDDVRLIDANALINGIMDEVKPIMAIIDGVPTALDKDADIIEYISDFPTIEAQPVKRGHWETKGGVHCTRCGWRPSGKVCDLFTNYCAGCGAEMRGDSNV